MDDICDDLLEEAVRMWHRDGALMTTSFAIGHSRSLFAQPIREHGCTISSQMRVELESLLVSTVGAVLMGRIDESFIAYRSPDDEPLSKGDLARLAETDPSVSTAIVLQAVDTKSQTATVHVARLAIGDRFTDTPWEYAVYEYDDGPYIPDAVKAIKLSDAMLIPVTDIQLREQMSDLGWVVVDSDQTNDDEDDE